MSQVQAILFNKNKWSLKSSLRWLHSHGFKPLKVHETIKFFRYRFRDPSKFSKLRNKKISNGIEFIFGFK